MNSKDHWETIKTHGFLDIANVDIMDEDGEMEIPVNGGVHLKNVNIVGEHLSKYDSMLSFHILRDILWADSAVL